MPGNPPPSRCLALFDCNQRICIPHNPVGEYVGHHALMIFTPLFILLLLLSGCLGKSQGEVRVVPPSKTETFQRPYDQLAACAKAYIETDSWTFGQPTVRSTHETARPLIRVNASYLGSTLFEVTFEPIPAVMTLVEYRHGYDGYDTQDHTWAIIERCAQPLALTSPTAP